MSGLLCFWLYKRTENRVYSVVSSLCIWGFFGSILIVGVMDSVEARDPTNFFMILFVMGVFWLLNQL